MRIVFTSVIALASSTAAFSPMSSSPVSTALDASKCGQYDFDVAIIGCGVGGHGAALHARAQGLETAVFSGADIGGTCVNRGCVPSKALLAASGRVREMKNDEHLKSLGITVEGEVKYDRQGIADHATNLASRVKGNLEASLVGLGVQVIEGRGSLTENAHEVKDEATGKVYTFKVSFVVEIHVTLGRIEIKFSQLFSPRTLSWLLVAFLLYLQASLSMKRLFSRLMVH